MAKRKGGSGFIYASLPLDMTQTLHELEEERPGTVSALILAYMDYAQDHAKEETVPEIVPEAPEGFSLAAKQNWRRLIQIYHGARGSYLAQVEGGKKAQPGPGRPKGSKNKPRESADTDTGSDAAEDREEPGQSAEAAADDIRITGKGPWLPSESDLKKKAWAWALAKGENSWSDERAHATANAIASQVWARLQNCNGYLAPNGMGGIDDSDLPRLFNALTPYYITPDDVPEQAALVWEVLRAWAAFDTWEWVEMKHGKFRVYVDYDFLIDLLQDGEIKRFPNGKWEWARRPKTNYGDSGELLWEINENCREDEQDDDTESTDQPDAQDTAQDTPEDDQDDEW